VSRAGRAAAALSALGAAALVAGGLALGAVAAPAGSASSAGPAATPVDVPVPAAGAELVCPGAPVPVTGAEGGARRSGDAPATATGTAGLVVATGAPALTGQALVQRPTSSDDGSDDGSDSASSSAGSARTGSSKALGDLQRLEGDATTAAAGTATALSAGPVDGRAPLLAGASTALAPSGDLRGLSTPACAAPQEQTWLVGGGAGVGRSTRLVLADVAQTPTTVDVTVLTSGGPQQPSSLQGLSLGPGEQRSVLLEGVLDGSTGGSTGGDPLAVQVRSSAGPVAAWLVESVLHGLVPGGTEVVGPAAAPATSLVVPGIAATGTQPAVLRLANPGTDPVVARFAVVGASGASVPSGTAPATAVPPQSVVDVALPGLPSGGVALAVEADGPVLAGVRTDTSPATDGSQPGDLAWTAAAPPLAGPALVALPPAAKQGRSGSPTAPDVRLVLSSRGASQVDVAVVGADGRTSTARRVELPASTTTAADVDDLARAAGAQGTPVALLLTPVAPAAGTGDDGAGQVVAALTARVAAPAGGGGDLVSAAPVGGGTAAPSSVPVTLTGP
jgi:hypothetical protein